VLGHSRGCVDSVRENSRILDVTERRRRIFHAVVAALIERILNPPADNVTPLD